MLFDVDTADVDSYVDHDMDYQPGVECSGATEAECCMNIFNNVLESQGKTPCRRKNNIRRTELVAAKALDFIPPSTAAARCAAKAIRQNPFVLKPIDEMNCITPGC
jgi:hypothetical protein